MLKDFLNLDAIKARLVELGQALIDQERAQVAIPPYDNADGFWFGGGNLQEDVDGTLLLTGRYRNFGDSRTGTGAGERGLELAIFQANSPSGPWEKIKSFSKSDLKCGGYDVVSIEGSGLIRKSDGSGYVLFVSTEKDRPYPSEIESFQKPGTGVWSIDTIEADTLDELDARNVNELLLSNEARDLHIKDPVPYLDGTGEVHMIYCHHPYSWSSSNTGIAELNQEEIKVDSLRDFFIQRGTSWDVACTRVTERLQLPAIGVLKDAPPMVLYFYDGAECLRRLDDSPLAVKRPRGWSCEEIGGLAYGLASGMGEVERLSENLPLFTSPKGTGCSRYVSACWTKDGLLATWQQSQDDFSQPLVSNFLPMVQVEEILSK